MKQNLVSVVILLGLVMGNGFLFSPISNTSLGATSERATTAHLPGSMPPAGNLSSPESSQSLSTTTDGRGYYIFRQLDDASHQVWLDLMTLPAGLRPGEAGASPRMLLHPGQSQVSDLLAGDVRFTASYDREAGTLDGWVFRDGNRNGIFDENETGLPQVTVFDPGVFVYFVPGHHGTAPPDVIDPVNGGMLDAYETIDSCTTDWSNDPALGLDSIISVTASNDNTTWFYDHWEDGYDADPLAPGAGSTTLTGTLSAGASQIFQTRNDVFAAPSTPPTVNTPASNYAFDGRDRITILGDPVNLTRNAWPSERNTVLAGSWEAYPVNRWGTDFVIPAGEDLADRDFLSVHLFIMAQADNTTVTYDLDGPGGNPPAAPVVLNQGESIHRFNPTPPGVNASSVLSGATIQASAPVQVHMLAGGCDPSYTARGFHILPDSRLENEYYLATPSFEDASCGIIDGNDRFSRVYIRNASGADISINWETNSGSGSFTAPMQATTAFTNPDFDSGVRLYTNNANEEFTILATVDQTQDYDWGYTPVPRTELTSEVVLGWSLGTADIVDNGTGTPPPDGVPDPPNPGPPAGLPNGNLAFVTPVTDTTVFVDLNNDGTPDDFDLDGSGVATPGTAAGVALNALDVLRVADPNDNDLSGAIIYTQNYQQQIAVAWGEDPCGAHTNSPHFDGGFTIPPLPVVTLTKDDSLVNDPASCSVNPGSVVTYTLVAENIGRAPLQSMEVVDALPFTSTDFIVGSQTTTPPATTVQYNNGTYTPGGSPGSLDPNVQSLEAIWTNVTAGQVVTLTLAVKIDHPLQGGITSVDNIGTLTSPEFAQVVRSTDPEDPFDPVTTTCINTNLPNLTLTKDDGQTIVSPGQVLTYTIPYTNNGLATAANSFITDTLPTGFQFISAGGGIAPPVFIAGPPDRVIFSLGDIPAPGGGVVTITGRVDPAFTGSIITNTAVIATETPELDPTDNSDDDVDVLLLPDLTLTKDDGETVVVQGQTLTYTVAYSNIGQATAANSFITDTLPAGFLYGSAGGGIAPPVFIAGPPDRVIFSLGDVPAPGGGVVTITGRVDPAFSGTTLTNTAIISTETPELNTTNNFDDDVDTLPVPNLDLIKLNQPTGAVRAGDTIDYTLCYSNTGAAPATGVVLVDPIPMNSAYVSGTAAAPNGETLEYFDGSTWSTTEPAAVAALRWLIGDLAPDSTQRCVSFGVRVNVGATGQVLNVATIDSNETDPIDRDVDNPIIDEVNPTLNKQSDPSEAQIGETVTFVINASNLGNQDVTGASIIDNIPDFLDVLSVSSAPDRSNTINGQTVTVDVGTMAPGFEIVVTIVTQINDKASPLPVTIQNNVSLVFNEGPPLTDKTTVSIPPPDDDDDGGPPPPASGPPPVPTSPPPPASPPGAVPTPAVTTLPETGGTSAAPVPWVGLWLAGSALIAVALGICYWQAHARSGGKDT